MDVLSAILKPVAETLMVPVKKHLGYLISCTKYVTNMGLKMRELNTAKVSVEEHTKQNTSCRLEVPTQVMGWLEEVEKITTKVDNVPTDVVGCMKLKTRHNLGRKAFKLIEKIDSVMTEHSLIVWTDRPIPLGRVDTVKASASTSTPSTDHNDFQSREVIFTKALEALGPNQNSHMIALCGMGGVGKTTMMQMLKKIVKEKKLFNFVAEAVIGEKSDPIAIQGEVASYLGIELKEPSKSARAERLLRWFKDNSDGGKTKFLIILDDVWQSVEMEDIGLSILPDQGVDFKVLLTSRDQQVCTMMGVEANSVLNVGILLPAEAQSLFWKFVETSDPELHKIGEDIVTKCCGLPIAIKTISCTLRNKKKDKWNDTLSRLEHHNVRTVAPKVFQMSYDNLEDDEIKSVFLLCGLFPEDFNIPTEELMRYGWGLNFFGRVHTIREARNRLNTCIERLRETNLLNESDDAGCVKMHDLVRSFVLQMFSEVEQASLVNYGSMSGTWPEENDMIGSSCKIISLTCKGMSEIPQYLNNFPNLSLFKLMHGDKSLRFPQDFYGEMKKLHVISYHQMKYPLLPSSPQCSTSLRVLHLHECSLRMFDCSSIGNHLNLEVLSFANSDIDCLPSSIGKLKKLKVLDLTNCSRLCIDNGVLQNLVKLEELYLLANSKYGKSISLTNENYNEISELSENLGAFEIEFFESDVITKKMSFHRLQRFKISVGCSLDQDLCRSGHPSENILKLETDKSRVVESRVNQLFEKTKVLSLSVGDMNDLSDVEVKSLHPPQSTSFQNLRVLVVSKCAELKYLFTHGVANTLSRLEHLQVFGCDNMEELIHTEDSGDDTITFSKLKYLYLYCLPNLSGLCHNANIIELPQLVELKLYYIPGFTSIYPKNKLETSSLLNEKILIPKLEKLHIDGMENLKEIWPCEFEASEEVQVCMLRRIEVMSCNSLVNLFPCNPMPLIHHLEELEVRGCGSIEVLFDIDLDLVGETGEGGNLRSIIVCNLSELREVWRIKGANSRLSIHGFQGIKCINIWRCRRFRSVFTPITANFDLGALMEVSIQNVAENGRNDERAESSHRGEINILSKEKEISQISDNISNSVFPSCVIHSFYNITKLEILNYEGIEVVFEMESPKSRKLVTTNDNQRLLPNLENLHIQMMKSMTHVWKCNWNKYFNLRKQPWESPFHNLTTIYVAYCKSIKYLFSPLMAKLLSNLKEVKINACYGIEEVISNRDDEDEENTMSPSTSTHISCSNLFPRLGSLTLDELRELRCIGGGGNNKLSRNSSAISTPFVDQFEFSGGVSWSLCQYAREIDIRFCNALSSAIPAGQMQKLQKLKILFCHGMKDVFETQGNSGPNNAISLKLVNLKMLEVGNCDLLEHVFPFSALESLGKLEELKIWDCKGMKVIVKEEYGEASSSKEEVVVFPRLKSIELYKLPELAGFFLGKNEFRLPCLDEVTIKKCPKMMAFTRGGSTSPQLKYMHTDLGKHSVTECGLNFHAHVTTIPEFPHHQTLLSLDSSSSRPAASEKWGPLSFHYLIELQLEFNKDVKKIIPSNEFLKLQKLEKIDVAYCDGVQEVFEAAGSESLPNITQVYLSYLKSLRYIWKSNEWTVFHFPNLTTLSIKGCDKLQHAFSSSMVGSLLQLQDLSIETCENMEEVIVKDSNDGVEEEEEEESHAKTNHLIITLPRLKSLKLKNLPRLKGFCLRKEDFSFPLFDTLLIDQCPAITIFTKGHSATPQLREIQINDGPFYAADVDINHFIKIKQEEFGRDPYDM